MHGKIVVGVDGSTQGDDALSLAASLAGPLDAEIILAHVSPYSLHNLTLYEQAGHRGLSKLLEEAMDRLPRVVRTRSRTQLIGSSPPAKGLHELARAEHAALVVVGSSHRGRPGRALAGTVGKKLLHGAPCAVAVAPLDLRKREATVDVIGVGYDGEPESEIALNAAVDLSKAMSARLLLVSAAHEPDPAFIGYGVVEAEVPTPQTAVERAQGLLDRALERLPDSVKAGGQVIAGGPSVLADVQGIDLMVIGSRGYGSLRQVLLGSVGARLVESARFPVLVMPRSADSPAETEDRDAVGVAG